jgi:hypothetical protein
VGAAAGGRAHEVAAQKMPFEIPIHNRAACLLSLLKPYLRILRGLSKLNVPGYVGFCQFLRHLRRQNAFEQAEMILPAA